MGDVVVVTASVGTLPGLTEALRTFATVEDHPLLSFSPPADWAPLDSALNRWDSYSAIAFTSPRAAEAVVQRLNALGVAHQVGGLHPVLWAGGAATATALGSALGSVRTPVESEAGGRGAAGALARAMLEAGVVSPVLFPCGEIRREELPERLRSGGVAVEEVICYRSVLASETAAHTAASRATVLVVSSPRVATLLAGVCRSQARPDLVAVGPTTAASARDAGWSPAAVAPMPSVEAVSRAVRSVMAKRAHD